MNLMSLMIFKDLWSCYIVIQNARIENCNLSRCLDMNKRDLYNTFAKDSFEKRGRERESKTKYHNILL